MTITDTDMEIMRTYARAVLLATAAAQTMTERCNAARQRVLDREHWDVRPDFAEHCGERVTSPRHDYLMAEADWPRYFAECADEMRGDGIRIDDPTRPPDMKWQSMRTIAEDAMLDFADEIAPGMGGAKTSYRLRAEAIRILLALANVDRVSVGY